METISSEICQKCGKCCRNFPFISLSQNDIGELGRFSGLPVEVFANKGEADEGYFLQFKENGDCFFLSENNGAYSCSVYEARSKICRNYPSNLNQDEACNTHRKMTPRNISTNQ